LQRHFDDRWRSNADSGIGDENVEPAIMFDDFRDDFDPSLFAGDILMPERRLAAGFLDAGDEFRPPEVVDIGHYHRRALARQQFGDRLTNARCAACDQRDLACNLPCHFHSHTTLLDCYRIIAGPGSGTATSATRICTRSAPCQRSTASEPATCNCWPRFCTSALPSFCPTARNAMALTMAPSPALKRSRRCAWPTSSAKINWCAGSAITGSGLPAPNGPARLSVLTKSAVTARAATAPSMNSSFSWRAA